MAEVQASGPGSYSADIYHSEDCLGLVHKSMLLCECMPQIEVRRVG
jgi:hypothetical protein